MAEYYGRSYDEIFLLALFYIISIVPIGYSILNIGIIILEISYINSICLTCYTTHPILK